MIDEALKIPAVMSWSGGKDSAYTLHKVLEQGLYEVKYLLSTFNGNTNTLSMHGVSEHLVEAQALQIGIPLWKVYVYETNNEAYEQQMKEALLKAKEVGINHVIYGDIFLQDLRQYREEKLKALNMHAVFPLWKMNKKELLKDFILKGFKTITCCVNNNYLDKIWVGKIINQDFINELPAAADACGENGEYHSFCYDAPFFKKALKIKPGAVNYQSLALNLVNESAGPVPSSTLGFWYCDLELAEMNSKHELKPCPRCGKTFECKVGDVAHCQCFGIVLNDKAINFIEKKYADCLCSNCLMFLSNENNLAD